MKHWLDYVTAFGAIATPLLVLVLTAVGWKLRQSVERRRQLEDKLREERIQSYNQILEPFIIMFMTDAAWTHDPKNKGKDRMHIATTKLLSLDYRNTSFKLALVGSDEVVRAYNDLIQHAFNVPSDGLKSEEMLKEMLGLIGGLLLAIRRSMGNEATELTKWQMLEWFITDARKFSVA